MRWQMCLAVLVFVLGGCQGREVDDNRLLAEEVMAIHDSAMAKMTTMHELRLHLQATDDNSVSAADRAAAVAQLQEAHRAMMQWMRDYRPPQTDSAFAGARPYLLAEKEKIFLVGAMIDDAIEHAETLLKP